MATFLSSSNELEALLHMLRTAAASQQSQRQLEDRPTFMNAHMLRLHSDVAQAVQPALRTAIARSSRELLSFFLRRLRNHSLGTAQAAHRHPALTRALQSLLKELNKSASNQQVLPSMAEAYNEKDYDQKMQEL